MTPGAKKETAEMKSEREEIERRRRKKAIRGKQG
jgi:hypothetical protein